MLPHLDFKIPVGVADVEDDPHAPAREAWAGAELRAAPSIVG